MPSPEPVPLTSYRTRREAAAALDAQGITGEEAERLLPETGSARHAQRIAKHCNAALEEYATVTRRPLDTVLASPSPAAARYGIAVLVLDALGVNPEEPSSAVVRHRAFRHGCGARSGPTSGAIAAAAYAALLALWAIAFGVPVTPRITLRPRCSDEGLWFLELELRDEGEETEPLFVALAVEPKDELDAQSPGWLQCAAMEGLRRSQGGLGLVLVGDARKAAARARGHNVLDLVRFGDVEPAAWTGISVALQQRRWIENVARRWHRVVADLRDRDPALLVPFPPAPGDGGGRVRLVSLLAWLDRSPLSAAWKEDLAGRLRAGRGDVESLGLRLAAGLFATAFPIDTSAMAGGGHP